MKKSSSKSSKKSDKKSDKKSSGVMISISPVSVKKNGSKKSSKSKKA